MKIVVATKKQRKQAFKKIKATNNHINTDCYCGTFLFISLYYSATCSKCNAMSG